MVKIILDTDLGNDPDDLFALAYCLGEPAWELAGVATVGAQAAQRKKLAQALLRLAGAPDIPAASGRSARRLLGPSETRGNDRVFFGYSEHFGLSPSERGEPPPEHLALYRSILESVPEGGAIILSIGPPLNLADAWEAMPDLMASRVAKVVAMGGLFEEVEPRSADKESASAPARRVEYNLSFDPASSNILLRSGLPIDLVGANVTRRFFLSASESADLLPTLPEGGASRAILEYLARYIFGPWRPDQALMHDALAALAAIAPEGLAWTPAAVSVAESGEITARPASERETRLRVATDFRDLEGLRARLFAAWRRV
jgi:purine nucleosidase